MFPIAWWALSSIKPYSAIFDRSGPVYTGFTPTPDNYRVTLLGVSRVDIGMEQGGVDNSTASQRGLLVQGCRRAVADRSE